jgi:hypothetical protein
MLRRPLNVSIITLYVVAVLNIFVLDQFETLAETLHTWHGIAITFTLRLSCRCPYHRVFPSDYWNSAG